MRRSRIAVAVLLVLMAVSPLAWASETTYTFTWPAMGHSEGVLTYTLYHINVATGDSTHLVTLEDDGAAEWTHPFTVPGGEVYDVTVRGWLPDGTSDSCTRRIEVPYVQNNGCTCALVD